MTNLESITVISVDVNCKFVVIAKSTPNRNDVFYFPLESVGFMNYDPIDMTLSIQFADDTSAVFENVYSVENTQALDQ
jgi:hypothetical protein